MTLVNHDPAALKLFRKYPDDVLYTLSDVGFWWLDFNKIDLRQDLGIVGWKLKDEFDKVVGVFKWPNANLKR